MGLPLLQLIACIDAIDGTVATVDTAASPSAGADWPSSYARWAAGRRAHAGTSGNSTSTTNTSSGARAANFFRLPSSRRFAHDVSLAANGDVQALRVARHVQASSLRSAQGAVDRLQALRRCTQQASTRGSVFSL